MIYRSMADSAAELEVEKAVGIGGVDSLDWEWAGPMVYVAWEIGQPEETL